MWGRFSVNTRGSGPFLCTGGDCVGAATYTRDGPAGVGCPLLPPAEASYRNNSGEEPNYREHAYDGGAPSALHGGKVNLEALEPTTGQPTFSAHLHGVGTYINYYVPEGVQLNGSMKEAEVTGKPDADFQRSVAAMLAGTVRTFSRGGSKLGRTFPDGKHWAGKLESGGYWNNWIVVRTAGQAEQRHQAGYFIADFHWLDDHRIVYGEMPMGWNDDLVIIDVNGRTTQRVTTPGRSEFGVVAPGKIWYKDDQGAHREIEVP
ncbi:MAG TPA: hypothetical protein VD973_09330 [Symbiobacteriaceae bacterium]|nr:hypothetical protein [Symbiobacteriaceae bacterium]